MRRGIDDMRFHMREGVIIELVSSEQKKPYYSHSHFQSPSTNVVSVRAVFVPRNLALQER